MTLDFDISSIVDQVGETVTISSVASTYNAWGDPANTYTPYVMNAVAQVMDGSEDEVQEGILSIEDVVLYVNAVEGNAPRLKKESHFTLSGANTVSGVYQIANVIHNHGHYEVHAKRIRDF